MSAVADLIPYRGDVYRNFATAYPSQEVTDDLVSRQRDQEILKRFFYRSAESSGQTKIERVLNKSVRQIIQEEISAKFNPQNWYASRYSDGTWGVLYSAESEQTALKEAVYHMKEFYREELLKRELILDRRVVRLTVHTDRCADLTANDRIDLNQLISKDRSGYPYCQKLARKLIDEGSEVLRTPSARDARGICAPIFKREIIKKDHGHLKYLKCVLTKKEAMIFGEEGMIPLGPD